MCVTVPEIGNSTHSSGLKILVLIKNKTQPTQTLKGLVEGSNGKTHFKRMEILLQLLWGRSSGSSVNCCSMPLHRAGQGDLWANYNYSD